MRVAHVTATFPPYLGGTGNVAYHHARLLHALGHTVTVFTPSASPAEEPFPFQVDYLPCVLRVGHAALTPALIAKLKNFDLIHLHYPYIFGAELATVTALVRRIPIVISYHNQLREQHPVKMRLFRAYNRLAEPPLLALANRILAVRRDHLLSIHPSLASHPRLMELSHGVDTDLFRPIAQELARAELGLPDDVPVLLFVGALDTAHRFKNVDGLLHAFAALSSQNALLLIAGNGNLRASFEKLAEQLGVGNRTRFLGRQCPERLPVVYSAADVLVLPSIEVESFGLVQIEALACGTAVITSDLPGVRTILDDGIDGYLVPAKDRAALVRALERVCHDRALARRMGASGREKIVLNYRWDDIGVKLERIYHEVVLQ